MFRYLIAPTLIISLWTGAAWAAPQGLDQGKVALEQGHYKQALNYLLIAFSHEPEDPQTNFLLGRAYFELGMHENAVMSFERVLLARPNSARAKLELARSYLALGSKEFARQYFQEVLATNPPEAVWNNIQRFLKSIKDSEQRHFFTGTLSLGLDIDDNPRTAPLSDSISLGILDLQLSGKGAEPDNDHAFVVSATLNHLYRPEDDAPLWKTSLLTYNSFYNDEHDLNVNYHQISTGPGFKNDYFLWQNNLLATAIDVEHERYLDSWGFSSTLTSQLIDRFILTGKLRFEDKDNKRYAFRSAENYQATAQAAFLLDAARLAFTFGKEIESASSRLVSYDRVLMQLRFDTPLPYGIALYASATAKFTTYKDEDPLFAVKRDDDRHEVAVGLSKSLWQDQERHQNLLLALSHRYTDTESNIDLYSYRRNSTNITLTYAF